MAAPRYNTVREECSPSTEKIATTQDGHEVTTRISLGEHHLLVVDEEGFSDQASFSVGLTE